MTSGTIHITSIEDCFDPQNDVAFGPHCFLGRENVYKHWMDLPYVKAFSNESELTKEEIELRNLVNYLLPSIANKLNKFHQTNHSEEFWRLIIMPWLIELSQRAWTSFLKASALIKMLNEKDMLVLICDTDMEWTFVETRDFFETMLRDYKFNWWIDSIVICEIAPANWTLKFSNFSPQKHAALPGNVQEGSGSQIRKALREFKYRLGYSDIVGIRWSGLIIAVYANLLPRKKLKALSKKNSDWAPKTHFSAKFLIVLEKLIETTMPRSFLEGFKKLAENASRLNYQPGRLRLGTLDFWNEKEKVIAAFAVESGEKRVVGQHGGEYGMLSYNMMANVMEHESCVFLSWGWKSKSFKKCNIVPLPSPLHSKIANLHKTKNNSLIVVGLAIRVHLNRLHWWTQGNTALRYCKDTVTFLSELSKKPLNSVLFRPYTRTINEIDIKEIVTNEYPDMSILETDLDTAMLDCKLVVLASFGSPMNFALASNTPTVIYLPRESMAPLPEVESYFSPLRACGILHDCPKSAAQQINKVWNNIPDWWNSNEVQNSRLQWVEYFAQTNRLWWWQWIKMLPKL